MTDYSHNKDRMIKYSESDLIHQIQEYNIDTKANHIYLTGEESYITPLEGEGEPGVEFSMANRFIKNMNILMRHTDKPILIHMKTCGGFWEEGMAIYDTIKACPNHVVILNYTHARSMSSIIFQAADKRVMMPHSTFMIHDGTMSMSGTVKQWHTETEQLKKTNQQMIKIYVDALKEKGQMSKWSRKRIEEHLRNQMDRKEEVYYSAEEAVKAGFADEIFGGDGKYDWKALLKED